MIPEYKTQLLEIETVARDTKIFRFIKPQNWSFEAGQFISLKFTETAFRAYSIASDPSEDLIELVVRLIPGGLGSEALKIAQIGQEFFFRGAFGMMKLSETAGAPQIFCATGTGIAPFRSMILAESKKENPRLMKLFYGGKDFADLAYLEELIEYDHLQIFFGLSQELETKNFEKLSTKNHVAQKCRITSFLETEVFCGTTEFYICGNGDMVKSVRGVLLEKNIDSKKIHQERFN